MVSERHSFSPTELDLIEDALERLETDGLPTSLGDADGDLAEELLAYREILQLSREALPLEEVPGGALDAVLEEARRSAATQSQPSKVPWWKRLRATVVVPALAFGGSAALILWMVRPAGEAEMHAQAERTQAAASDQSVVDERAVAEPPADNKIIGSEDAPLADATKLEAQEPAAFAEGELGRAQGALSEPAEEAPADADEAASRRNRILERDAELDDVLGGVGDVPGAVPSKRKSAGAPAKPEPSPKPSKSVPSGGSKGGGSGSSSPFQPQAPAPKQDAPEKKKSKDEDPAFAQKELELADARRRSSSCASARPIYQRLRAAADPSVRARALAGLGLCEMDAGRTSAADALFDQARAADPGVSKFIDRELASRSQQKAAPPQADQAESL